MKKHNESVLTAEQASYLRFRQAIIGNVGNEASHIIDCDEPSFDTNDMPVVIHERCGKLKWDIERQSNALWSINNLTHDELSGAVAGRSVLNANVLDHLLKQPHLIPIEWEGKTIHFFGTRYHDYDGTGYLHIRSLCQDRNSGEWSWEYNICDDDLCCLTGHVALRVPAANVSKKT